MLIYNDIKKEVKTHAFINHIIGLAESAEAKSAADNLTVTELFLCYSEFESAVTDSLSLAEDGISALVQALRSAGEITGEMYLHSSEGMKYEKNSDLPGLLKKVSLARELPQKILLSVPEGYAFYSLYPEMYIEAVKRYVSADNSGAAVVIGIRSIGCSLASIAAAVLKNAGWNARSFTVRPRGEYFSRKLKISGGLRNELLKRNNIKYLLLDEGPGLSGTSFASVAEYLSLNGVSDEDIIIFPGWDADGSSFVSDESRTRWQRHKKIFVDFEEAILKRGKLKRAFGYDSIEDISAGEWRRLFYGDVKKYPHTFAAAEQRKYLITRAGKKYILKFSGLGTYGNRLFERGKVLCEAGFSPAVRRLDSGFIEFEFAEGTRPEACRQDERFVHRIAAYCNYLAENFHETPAVSTEDLKEMIRINTGKGLGPEWGKRLTRHALMDISDPVERPAAVDGRMLPFEWLCTGKMMHYMKTDSLQHHAGHFIPGSADIAWDIAGTIIEFRMPIEKAFFIIRAYTVLSGDRHIGKRIPFYLLAYSAFRLGYTSFAAGRAAGISDQKKLIYQSNYYKKTLRKILSGGILLH